MGPSPCGSRVEEGELLLENHVINHCPRLIVSVRNINWVFFWAYLVTPRTKSQPELYTYIRSGPTQSDQIGRIFAYWTIVSFWQIFENDKSSPKFMATFILPKRYVHIDFLQENE
jgi:hypothetical protein